MMMMAFASDWITTGATMPEATLKSVHSLYSKGAAGSAIFAKF